MLEPKLQNALHTLAKATRELSDVCDREVKTFSGSWNRIANNSHVLESSESVDPDDIRSLLGSIRAMFSYHPGSFMEAYIARADFEEQSRENEHFDALKNRVGSAAAEVRSILKIDPRSY